jgi:hypothetical protein
MANIKWRKEKGQDVWMGRLGSEIVARIHITRSTGYFAVAWLPMSTHEMKLPTMESARAFAETQWGDWLRSAELTEAE